ncbi:MAG: hypothetical protein GY790_12660 [Bacteroidetes bacterium]|nr:hypothetical protein [Bacteroidota bacterium]
MQRLLPIILTILALPINSLLAQEIRTKSHEEEDWDRTRMIMDCSPRLVDRRDLVEDNFDHRYVTNNPRDIEVGYFSVEPITYMEEGRRFCEARLPAAGVSQSYFRGCYATTYTLPGDGLYSIEIESRALVFSNEILIINAQHSLGEIESSHRMEIELDTALNPVSPSEQTYVSNPLFNWAVEIDQSGRWNGELRPGTIELTDSEIPAGISSLVIKRKVRGPGVISVRESVVFNVNSVSAFKYDPIFQADCHFSLDPLEISTRLLPCE